MDGYDDSEGKVFARREFSPRFRAVVIYRHSDLRQDPVDFRPFKKSAIDETTLIFAVLRMSIQRILLSNHGRMRLRRNFWHRWCREL
jgi:hypothetical protein